MPRLREVPRSEVHPFGEMIYGLIFGDRDPVSDPGTASGTPGNWWTVTAWCPMRSTTSRGGLQFYRSPDRLLSPQLRELGQLRAGWARGSKFVYSQHCKAARDVGFSDEQVDALPNWQVADCFEPIQRAVLAYTDCLVLQGGRVPDGVMDALKARAVRRGDPGAHLHHVHLRHAHDDVAGALRMEYDDHDDPMVEVPDPSGRCAGLEVFVEGGSYADVGEDDG